MYLGVTMGRCIQDGFKAIRDGIGLRSYGTGEMVWVKVDFSKN